jgi:hypothetical protein
MSDLGDKIWRFVNGIVSLAFNFLFFLIILGLIFSPNIRSNFTYIYETLSMNGIVGLYVAIVFTYTMFISVMDVLLAIYNAGGINRNLITKITNGKIKSKFETWMGRIIYIFLPIMVQITAIKRIRTYLIGVVAIQLKAKENASLKILKWVAL